MFSWRARLAKVPSLRSGSPTKPRILVVDDDKSICNLLKAVLEMEEYGHRVASSGEEARRLMASDRFDVLISDIYLGDDSGLNLLAQMKEINPNAEVVIMTAHGSVEIGRASC